MGEQLEENGRTIVRKWENNWKKMGDQLEENGRKVGRKSENCNWKKMSKQFEKKWENNC